MYILYIKEMIELNDEILNRDVNIDNKAQDVVYNPDKAQDVVYNPDKDFYRGMGGELRYKAEGLFKKAKEKGISIEDIDVAALKENTVDFPGIGSMDLPAFFVKVKGKHIPSGQIMIDGKQIDYFNRYQKYIADRIESKNYVKDERGRVVRESGKPLMKGEATFDLSDWDRFEIGRSLADDKEFGLEKTITGACDRLIRKLMGENDWLYPEEARLLDEEFNSVQNSIAREKAEKRLSLEAAKKATERQVNFLKAKIKNSGMNPDNDVVIREVLRQTGFDAADMKELSTGEMSKVIDSVGSVMPKVKDILAKQPS